MTNAEIILGTQLEMVKAGRLGTTGRKIEISFCGEVREIDEPEAIHTYRIWQSLGYQVRKGQKSDIHIKIWKKVADRKKDGETAEKTANIEDCPRMIMKTAHFFRRSQVDRIGDGE